jgi:DNA mismatch repair protein MutS2
VVRVRHLNEVGELVSMNPTRGEGEVQLGAFKAKVSLDDLERVRGAKPADLGRESARKPAAMVEARPAPKMDFDIRGWRADDVAQELDKYLDEAYLSGLPFVRIIHGKGTGVLRQVVREQLAKHPLVKTTRPGEANEGGEGATIAVFKG